MAASPQMGLPGETNEMYMDRVLKKLKEPRIQLYLEHLDHVRQNHMKTTQVEIIDTQLFTEINTGADTTALTATSNKSASKIPAGGYTSYFRSPEEMRAGPPPSMVNDSNWRPPSPPSRKGTGIASGNIVAEPYSRLTTRTKVDFERKSPWKKREPRYIRTDERVDSTTSLASLEFNENFYKTFPERMKDVESSGYGQKEIEKAAQQTLGMTLSEFREEATFQRLPPPILHRRIILADGMLAIIKPHASHKKPKIHKEIKTVPIHTMALETGRMDTTGPLKDFSAWSIDLESPGGFLQALHDKDFTARKRFLTKNGWNTRGMKVTNNSTDTTGDGATSWFLAECRSLNIVDDSGLNTELLKMQNRHRTKGIRVRTASTDFGFGVDPEISTPTQSREGSERGTRLRTPRLDDDEAVDNYDKNSQWGPLSEQNLKDHTCDDEENTGGLRRIESCMTNATMATAVTGATTQDGVSVDIEVIAVGTHDSSQTPRPAPQELLSPQKKSKRKGEEAPQYHVLKEPSDALSKYVDTVMTEYSSRKYLDGKNKCHLTSKFALTNSEEDTVPGPNGEDLATDAVASRRTTELFANKKKDMSLITSLLPAHLHTSAALDKTRREIEKKRRRDVGLNSVATSLNPTKTSETNYSALNQMHETFKTKDKKLNEIEAWQDFSVKVAVRSKLGPSKSLPVLSMAPKDPFKKPPKKSSLKFGSGNLAESEGQDSMEFKSFSSYLDVYKATYAKKNSRR